MSSMSTESPATQLQRTVLSQRTGGACAPCWRRLLPKASQETMDEILKKLNLNRLGQPEDVANAVLYLASDEASYVTGHILVVCGGGFIS